MDHRHRSGLRAVTAMLFILSLCLLNLPATTAPQPLQPTAISTACRNAAMNGTWQAMINLSYAKTASKPGVQITHQQQGNATLTFQLNSPPTRTSERLWQATEVQGNGTLETTIIETHPTQGERTTVTRGAGPINLSAAQIRLDPVQCRYSLLVWLWMTTTTTYPDGSQTQGASSVIHAEVYNIAIDDSAHGNAIPTLSGAAAPPARLRGIAPEQDMFWAAESANRIGSILAEQGNSTAGNADLDWTIRPLSNGPQINDVIFKHQEVNSERWINISGQRGSVDGNLVAIFARIHNPLGTMISLPIRFYDDETNELLPDCDEEIALSPDPTAINEATCVWDTEGWAWDDPIGNHPARQHANRRIRVELGAPGQLLDSVKRPFVVRPKPIILIHGLNSNAQGWSSYPGFARQANDYWEAYAVPGLRTGDDLASQKASATLLHNAQTVHTYIEQVRELENAWHVDIVAHSMGGLIARQYIHSFMPAPSVTLRPVVKHLLMLGTPNQGSACATVQLQIALRYGFDNLLAPADLVPERVAQFNQIVTNERGVAFAVLAGNSWERFLCDPQTIPNDMVVTVPSAHHIYRDVGLTPRNHIEMTSSRNDFVEWVLPRLAVGREHTPQVNAAVAQPHATHAHNNALAVAQFATAQVPAHGSATLDLNLPRASNVSIALISAPGVSISLHDPAGTQVDTSEAALASALRGFTLIQPQPGTWTLRANSSTDSPSGIYVAVVVAGDTFMLAGQLGEADSAGAALLSATVEHDGALRSSAQVTAELLRTDGTTTTLPLIAQGEGRYEASIAAAETLVAVAIRATDSSNERHVIVSAGGAANAPAPQVIYLPLMR